MYNFNDANMQTITFVIIILLSTCSNTCMYMDEIGQISTFLVRNLIVILQWGVGGKGGEGEVDICAYTCYYLSE